jgi:hypothetical protein
MTSYMFQESIPLFTRGLSLFHGWLPFLLMWMVWRLGYDRRAFVGWTVMAMGLLLVCFLFMPPPPTPADNPNLPVNINYCYGPSDDGAQTWLEPHVYLAAYAVALIVVFFLPTHLFLRRFGPVAARAGGDCQQGISLQTTAPRL